MSKSGDLSDELLALQNEMSRLLDMSAADMLDAARSRSEALADQVKAALRELAAAKAAAETD